MGGGVAPAPGITPPRPLVLGNFGVQVDVAKLLEEDESLDEQKLRKLVLERIEADYDAKVESVGASLMRELERPVLT